MKNLQIIPSILLDEYKNLVDENKFFQAFNDLKDAEISTENFSFYTSVSSVFSSKIEGENIELDSFVKHKRFGVEYLPDYTKKIDDLYDAYSFAKTSILNQENVEKAHKILSKHIVVMHQQGKVRNYNMYVASADGRIEYVAATPFEVVDEMEKLYDDISFLLNAELNIQEIFFFASFIHLVFVKIHPFNDGNGRTGRLLEKWFLAQKLGENAFFIQSEKNYYQHHQTYYNNLRVLGLEYQDLNYSKAMPFLLMLAQSILKNDTY